MDISTVDLESRAILAVRFPSCPQSAGKFLHACTRSVSLRVAPCISWTHMSSSVAAFSRVCCDTANRRGGMVRYFDGAARGKTVFSRMGVYKPRFHQWKTLAA